MLTSTLIAATFVNTLSNPVHVAPTSQLVPLSQYVDYMVQQTVVQTNYDIHIDVQTMVLSATHNFSLDDTGPAIKTNIEMQDRVKASAKQTLEAMLSTDLKINDKATAE